MMMVRDADALVFAPETEVVKFGVLDWELCSTRWDHSASADVYFSEDKFVARIPFYLVEGAYKFYYTTVKPMTSQVGRCEQVWTQQGNNFEGSKVDHKERSFSMGDIVVLPNQTIWVCVGSGWRCLNVGVI
jgi:hypothetical protein